MPRRILARRASLAPKARGLGHVAAWQFIEDLCRMERRERNLRRAGEVEVLALDSVDVDRLGWKEPGTVHRLVPHEYRWQHRYVPTFDGTLERVAIERQFQQGKVSDTVREAGS